MARHSLPKDLKALQDGLIDFYTGRMSCLPIAPLVEHHNAPVVDIYVLPRMMIADKPTFGKRIKDSEKIPIYKYKNLFEDQQKSKEFKKIFITAGGGMGKSAFARKMMLTWCKAKSKDKKIEQNFPEDDIKTMRKFDFLFLLELRDSHKCDITEMVQTFVNNNIRSVFEAAGEKVLNDYKCLVLLDGLDQWKHKEECFKTCKRDMPFNRYIRGNVTMVTTSRPWRVIRLKRNDVERHVELSNLTRRASQQLEKNVITFLMNYQSGSNVSEVDILQSVDEFDARMYVSQLEDVRCTPYILLQELCLWVEESQIRETKFEAYRCAVELTLKKFSEGEIRMEPERKDTDVPYYLENTELKKYYHRLLRLGRLAFKMMCKQIEDQSYKKTRKKAEKGLQHLHFFMKTGFLSETKDHESISEIKTFISFQEKAFQEFFAALYISHEWDNILERRRIVKKCLRIPNVMEMSNVLSFVRDIDRKLHEEIYNTVVRRTDLIKYMCESKQKVRFFGGTFLQIEEAEMKNIVKHDNGEGIEGYLLDTKYGKLCAKKVKVQAETRKAIISYLKQELRTSKLLHPFLLSAVTLLQSESEDEETFYLLSPHFVSLDESLQGQKGITLNWFDKVRISLQLALGIEHLHTPVPGIRGPVIHGNVCMTKIMIDSKQNVRLNCHGIKLEQDVLMKKNDYASFANVIRKLFSTDELKGTGDLSKAEDDMPEGYGTISELVNKCLKADEFSFKSEVIDTLQKFYKSGNYPSLLRFDATDVKRCSFCMINLAASGEIEKMHRRKNCRGTKSFHICFNCELNLCFNPMKCLGCDETLQPAIGFGWGAILVAGNDKNEQLAENFARDLQDVKKLVTCQTPLLMGIREENVKVIQPETPGQDETLTKKLEKAIDEIKNSQEKIHTLLVYFSCHGKEQGGKLQLGSENDLLDKSSLEKWLGGLKLDKAIFFMDHCYPTNIKLAGETRTIQLNSCKSDKQTSGGSPFTKYLIEAMIEKASRGFRNSTEGAYVSATNLLERVTQLFKQNGMETEPVFYIPDSSRCEDIHIAYCNLQSVEVTFCHNTQREKIQIDVLQTIMEIRRDVCLAFEKDEMAYSVEIRRHTVRRPVNTDGTLVKEKKTEKDKTVPERVDKTQDIILAHILQEKLEVVFTECSAASYMPDREEKS